MSGDGRQEALQTRHISATVGLGDECVAWGYPALWNGFVDCYLRRGSNQHLRGVRAEASKRCD